MTAQVTLHPRWLQAAFALVESGAYGYGDLIPHDDLRAELGLPRPDDNAGIPEYERWQFRMLQALDRLQEYLLTEHNMLMVSERGIGYRILHPSDQLTYTTGTANERIRREINRAARRLAHIDNSQLTAGERRAAADSMCRLAFLRSAVRRSRHVTADAPQPPVIDLKR